MTTQTTDQGLVLPSAPDGDNVPLSFSSYNAGVESRLVKRYTSTADRTARNATPAEGELSYLIDVNRYDYYTGSAWFPVSGLPLNQDGINNVAGASSTTSATFVNLPATSSFSFTKLHTSTRLKAEMHVTCFIATATGGVRFALQIAGTDYDIAGYTFNATADHRQISGTRYLPAGIAAGALTIQGRWRRNGGAGTLNIDAGDWLSISVAEVI